jgi:hypothetical protein
MYAEAAVDGSKATLWAPDPGTSSASLTVDLGSRTTLAAVSVTWTDTLPASSSVQVSIDGATWTTVPAGQLQTPVTARYVRVNLTRGSSPDRTGIRELTVTQAS